MLLLGQVVVGGDVLVLEGEAFFAACTFHSVAMFG